jgi:hypothetical protein
MKTNMSHNEIHPTFSVVIPYDTLTLKMKAARSSELLPYRITTRHNNPEDLDLNIYHRENLKSRIQYNV